MHRLLPLLIAFGIVAAMGVSARAGSPRAAQVTPTAANYLPIVRNAPTVTLISPPTITPEPTPIFITNTPAAKGFRNGDFEQGHTAWIEIPGNAVITKFSGVAAFQGKWLAHLEGVQNTHPEIQQEINLGSAPVYLAYKRQIRSADAVSGSDRFVILADTTELSNEVLGASTDTAGKWIGRSIHLSAFANRSVTIRFRVDQSSDQQTDVYLDMVGLAVPVP